MAQYINKYIFIFFLFVINGKYFFFYLHDNSEKFIFTFWEPKEKIPGYLSLCIKTWKKFLPDYKIIILDYKKVRYYLGEKIYSSIISKEMSLMVQSDAIRIAILNKFGGIWMDADNIITNGRFIKNLENHELAMVIEKPANTPFIGFISASKNSTIIQEWLKRIIENVKIFKYINSNKNDTSSWKKSWEDVNAWYYLGNGIINSLVNNVKNISFYGIDWKQINVFPELNYFTNSSLDFYQKYLYFFFEKGDPHMVLNTSQDLVFLFNSWTPPKYKSMTETEFLNQDILLSKLLASLLNIKKL